MKLVTNLANPNDIVSIVMPAHNSQQWITEAIESVQAQTYTDWQLVIVDDGSEDETLKIAESFAFSDPRIEVVRIPKKVGPGAARNRAIARARGRWLAFLDSDDWWRPEKLRLSIKHAIENQSALVFTGYVGFFEKSRAWSKEISVPAKLSHADLLCTNQIATSTALVDRHLWPLVHLREDMFFDDYILWLEILRGGHLAHGINQPLSVYRIGPGSFSSNKLEAARRVWRIYREVEGLSRTRSSLYFSLYALHGVVKHSYRRARA